jgi:hypothetical protein
MSFYDLINIDTSDVSFRKVVKKVVPWTILSLIRTYGLDLESVDSAC